jgi:hypothetical protein
VGSSGGHCVRNDSSFFIDVNPDHKSQGHPKTTVALHIVRSGDIHKSSERRIQATGTLVTCEKRRPLTAIDGQVEAAIIIIVFDIRVSGSETEDI